jgi:hypothetical protein
MSADVGTMESMSTNLSELPTTPGRPRPRTCQLLARSRLPPELGAKTGHVRPS